MFGVHKVVIAPFNCNGPKTSQFKAASFKDEDTLNTAIAFAKQAGLNKIKLLNGDFYIYGQVKLNNLEIEGEDEVFIRSTGFSKHIFTSEKSFGLSEVNICQQQMSELYINREDLNQEELAPYLEDKSFTQPTAMVLCSSYAIKEDTRSSVYITATNFVYIKDVTFRCALNKTLHFKKTKKILLEDVSFDSTNQSFDIEDVFNLTLINVSV